MARAGQKLKLECEVETNEPPTLIWFHNGKIMKEIKDFKVKHNFVKIYLFILCNYYLFLKPIRFLKIGVKLI